MDVEDDHPTPNEAEELEPRMPALEDLLELCRELNAREARYVIVGGFAIRAAGYVRPTMDVDLLMATDLENEAKVFKALEVFPDKAVQQLEPGEVEKYTVVRVADEIVVDLMKSACGIDYVEASKNVVMHEVQGVKIPFASPQLLWRMKKPTMREKDAPDLLFLREYFRQRGEQPPEV